MKLSKKNILAKALFFTLMFLSCTAEAKSFFLGSYPYEADGRSRPVEWIVIREMPDGKMLAASKYAIDAMDFNDGPNAQITWENSALRRWLNGYFLHAAFTKEEKNRLAKMPLLPADNAAYKVSGGSPTKDKVFLLSAEEAEKFFASGKERIIYPTPYTASKPVIKSENGAVNWWLRTVGRKDDDDPEEPRLCTNTGCMARVTFNGRIHIYGTMIYSSSNALYGIRPAIMLEPENKKNGDDEKQNRKQEPVLPENFQLKTWKQ